MGESVLGREAFVLAFAVATCGCGGTTLDAGTNERGGLVYVQEGKSDPLEGAVITLVDSKNSIYRVRSDATGRFDMPPPQDWAPTYPLLATIAYNGETRRMQSPIYGDTPCSSCHPHGIFLRSP